MASKMKYGFAWIVLLGLLALSACGANNSGATPTQSGLDAVYTAAAGTVMAQLTGDAAVRPSTTITPTATGTATATPTPPVAVTATITATLVPFSGGNQGPSGCNNSAFITDVTIPDNQQLAPGQAFTKTWRVQNNGSCAWNANYKIAFVSGDVMGGAATALAQTVNANGTVDISVNMVAPTSPKTYIGYWRLSTDNGQAFGTLLYVQIVVAGASVTPGTPGTGTVTAQPSITPTFGAVGCYNSALVSQSTNPAVGDIDAGDSFTQTWVVKNTGTCEWTSDFKLAFVSNPMGSDSFKIRRTVAPNGTTDFVVNLVAPTVPGTYTSSWRLVTDDDKSFGVSFSVTVTIAGATYTPTLTPAANATNTVTPTPVATRTKAPTRTPTPTEPEPSETPTETATP